MKVSTRVEYGMLALADIALYAETEPAYPPRTLRSARISRRNTWSRF